jgi:ABC-type sugar transport system permease subunit
MKNIVESPGALESKISSEIFPVRKLSQSLTTVEGRRTLWEILFVSPQLLLYLGLTIVPLLVSIPIVLTDRINFTDQNVDFVGLSNFVTIFQAPLIEQFLPSLSRTVILTLSNYVLVFVFGLTLALLMYEGKFSGLFFTLIYMPYMLSGLGTGMLLIMLFSRDQGSINLLLMNLGILKEPFDIKDPTITAYALPLILGWRYAGFNMALFLAGLMSIPTETIDASKVDGANYWQRLIFIYLPQIVPSIIIATIFCLIGSFGVFDEPVGLGAFYGNRSAEYFAVTIFKLGFGSTIGQQIGTMAQGIAMSLVVFVPLMVIAIYLIRVQKKLQYY